MSAEHFRRLWREDYRDNPSVTPEAQAIQAISSAMSAWRSVVGRSIEALVGRLDFPGEEAFFPPADIVRAGVVVVAVPHIFVHLTVFAGALKNTVLVRDVAAVFAVRHLEPETFLTGPESEIAGVSGLDAVETVSFSVVGHGPAVAEYTSYQAEEHKYVKGYITFDFHPSSLFRPGGLVRVSYPFGSDDGPH